MAQQYKQQSGRSMYANEIKLIKQGFEALGSCGRNSESSALERAKELHSDTHYGFLALMTSDHLIEVYAKPKD